MRPMFYLYKWDKLKEHSPHPQTRNMWLYKYGAFGLYNGYWFPCKITKHSMIGEPATVLAIPIATVNQDLYPKGEIAVGDMQVLYSVFSTGVSIEVYIQEAMRRHNVTNRMLNAAIKRSLNTELLYSPTRLMNDVKKAANREDKENVFVLNVKLKDEVGVIPMPMTVDIIEKLWNSNDWAMQEISQLLGVSYNPTQGKKERMLTNELLGDRDLTIMNREMITDRLKTAAKEIGEDVIHISSEIDLWDRQLRYGHPNPEIADMSASKGTDPNGRGNNTDGGNVV